MKRIPDLPQEELHFYAGIRGSFSFPIPLGIECGPLRQLEVEEMPHPLATKRLLEMRQFGLSGHATEAKNAVFQCQGPHSGKRQEGLQEAC